MDFVHLHNHSDYSVLDGAITIDKLIERTKELGMKAVALTDHGNMFGAVEFYQKANRAGVKPIVGEEFYMSPGKRTDHSEQNSVKDSNGEKAYHLVLLAENEQGYKNMMKLSSIGYTEGFYYKPRIDMEVLEKYSAGLICSSACLAGEIPRCIMRGRPKEAREIAGRFNEIFGRDRFYLELQDHGIPEQKTVNDELIKISSELNIPLIVTNDAHYVKKEDAYSHEILLCVQTGKTVKDENRMRFATNEFYLKSPEEMTALFKDYPQAAANTVKIAEMVDLTIDLGHPALPQFDVPEGYDLNSYLLHLATQGANRIYGTPLPDAVQKRLSYEYEVISNMGFAGYFLIIWDFIKEARRMNIPVGPGRGSGAGSIISYCLGITSLDPLKYDLLFERFLNPERNELPDMDLDFCSVRRKEVIDYVKRKYGEDKVSQIITFNKMMAKGVVKDVARVLDIPFDRANEISKMIPNNSSLRQALEMSPELKKFYKSGPEAKQLIDISFRLEGLTRSAGKHAAGVVISKGELTDYVPLYVDTKEGGVTSQYEKNSLEQAGLVKMDFLGLENLTVIDYCITLIKQTTGEEINFDNMTLDDPGVFALLQKGDTIGVFQLESGGMQNLLRRLCPNVIDDIIAVVALYRPGPLKSGMADDFVIRKNDPKKVRYPFPQLEPVLKDTLGVIIYQEQVMLISRVIGGFTMPEADKLRKAMGKKKPDIIAALKEKFVKGAAAQGLDVKKAGALYDQMEKFGEYGFNKSHSAAYAIVTYQTAYLKAHYYIYYMAALLSNDPDSSTKFIADCKAHGVGVLPPSINLSSYAFTVEGNKIRFGFSAVKGLGEKVIEGIIASRKKGGRFTSLKDFFERVDMASINKGVVEALVKAGAFDELNSNRAMILASTDFLLETGRRLQADNATGQFDLFGGDDGGSQRDIELLQAEVWSESERLEHEKEALGLYLSGHPLARYEKEISSFSSTSIADLYEIEGDAKPASASIAGIVQNWAVKQSKKGKMYGVGKLEDLGGAIDIIVFEKTLESYGDILASGKPVLVEGKLEFEEDIPSKLLVNSAAMLAGMRRKAISAIHIKIDTSDGADDNLIGGIKSVLESYRGDCPVYVHAGAGSEEQVIKVNKAFNVVPSEALVSELCKLVGDDSVRCAIGN